MVFPSEIVIADDEQQYDPELTLEIRPSEGELLVAVGWEITGRERWGVTGEMVNVYEPAPERSPEYSVNRNGVLEARTGGLMFRDGALTRWGETKKGTELRQVERSRGVKGAAAKPGRAASAIQSYLGLKGAVSPFTATGYSTPLSSEPAINDCYDPLPGVEEAREVLRQYGIDGSTPFERLPFPATRCPDGLIGGDQWTGGVHHPNPTSSRPAGREPEFVRRIETVDYVDHIRRILGNHARVLDLAISDTPAADIGVAMGLAPAYAAKQGAKLIDDAIDKLIEIDETARGDFGDIPKKLAA
jgi:hypothetical protein